jgi:hypothetical protein
MDWFISPLAHYFFLALALIACLALFLDMKREIAVLRHSLIQCRDSAIASAAALSAELESLRGQVSAGIAPDRLGAASPEAAPCAGQELNLTRRAQALRMQRRGEAPATITAALRLPRNEVDLLLKIERLAQLYTPQETDGDKQSSLQN